MATNFPTSTDDGTSLPNPTGASVLNSPDHAGLHSNSNGAIIALETKMGTGAATPVANRLLTATGTGTSDWSKVSPTGTIVGTSDSQVLTNKTLTSPTINGGTLDNATVTVDAVSGHSVSNTGTVYGISVTTGTIAAAAIATGAVTFTKLGTDSSYVWTTFSPAPTGFSGSPTTNFARYQQLGKTVFVAIDMTGTSNATGFTFTLPVAPKNNFQMPVSVEDNTAYPAAFGMVKVAGASTTATVYLNNASGAFTASGTKALTGAYLVYEVA